MRLIYSKEIVNYVMKNAPRMSFQAIIKHTNERFGTEFNYSKMRSFIRNHKIKIGIRTDFAKNIYEPYIEQLIEMYYPGHSHREIIAIIESITDVKIQKSQLDHYIKNKKYVTGFDGRFGKGQPSPNKGKKWDDFMSSEAQERAKAKWFKKGQQSQNTVPIGTITKASDGYWWMKVCESPDHYTAWKLCARIEWEKHNGPIPEGMVLTYLDGNPDNYDISNLEMITKNENKIMNQNKYRSQNSELTKAGIQLARLRAAFYKRRKEKKNGNKR